MSAFYPGRAPIDAYGNGGFRFAGMSHVGSLLVLPSGIGEWLPAMPLKPEDFARVFAEASSIDYILLGTGTEMLRPPREVREAFAVRSLGIEPMTTGAAVTTYNVLLGEGRRVGAALIAVQNTR